jgi:hypothetical protein
VGGWVELHILDLCRVFPRHLAYRYPAVGFYVKNSPLFLCKIVLFPLIAYAHFLFWELDDNFFQRLHEIFRQNMFPYCPYLVLVLANLSVRFLFTLLDPFPAIQPTEPMMQVLLAVYLTY